MSSNYIESAQRTLNLEKEAIASSLARLDHNFENACDIMFNCKGRVIVTGMGKSGHIGNKIAATLASTGTPAFFLHPAEASHGDLGMVTKHDVILALSNSGTTKEIVALLPLFKRLQIKIVALTGNPNSILAEAADAHIHAGVDKEACPLNLAPTSSTTVCLALGDALAIALLEKSGFTSEEFAFSHPGGALGRKLLLLVKDLMHSDDKIPRVAENCLLKDALIEISAKGLGMTTVLDAQGTPIGIFTDGDLRRVLASDCDIHTALIGDVMHKGFTSISSQALAAEALNVMEDKKITTLIATDEENNLNGIIHLHDILEAGIA